MTATIARPSCSGEVRRAAMHQDSRASPWNPLPEPEVVTHDNDLCPKRRSCAPAQGGRVSGVCPPERQARKWPSIYRGKSPACGSSGVHSQDLPGMTAQRRGGNATCCEHVRDGTWVTVDR